MGNFSERQEAKKETKEKDRTRREKLAGYFFDLSKLIFAALVLGGITPFMCTVFGETGGDSLSYLHSTLTYPKMPKTGSHRVKPNNSTPNSTHAASVKAVITIFMLVLTFINPVLFIIPTALCSYALSKSNTI